MGKINANKFDQIETARASKSAEAARGKKLSGEKAITPDGEDDRMEFSGRAAEVGRAMEAIRELPEVREDLVRELRGKIEAGTYKPTGDEIADAIVKDETA